MQWLKKVLRKRVADPAEEVVGAQTQLGLVGWEGAGKWPQDNSPASRVNDPEVDLWVNADPGRPSAGV